MQCVPQKTSQTAAEPYQSPSQVRAALGERGQHNATGGSHDPVTFRATISFGPNVAVSSFRRRVRWSLAAAIGLLCLFAGNWLCGATLASRVGVDAENYNVMFEFFTARITWPDTRVASSRLEQQNGHLAKVEVDEMLGLVRYVRAEVAANDAVPGGRVLLVELLRGTTDSDRCR